MTDPVTLLIEEVPQLRGYTVEWAGSGGFYLSRRNELFHSEHLKPPFTPVVTITAPWWKALLSRVRLAQRLLRFMVTNIVVLGNGDLLVVFDKSVGIVRDGVFAELLGIERPFRVLRSAIAVLPNGDVFLGEYRLNTERSEVNIYRYPAGTLGATAEVAYTFPAGSIAHVHGLYFDERTNAIYCLTGDNALECQILRTFDGFASLEVVGHRDESWRAVSIQFRGDDFFYGTDASLVANHIYRTNRTSMERTQLAEVDGPVLFSARMGNDLIFSTSAEAAPSQADDVASVWVVTVDGACEKLASFRKDRWHHTWFKLGTIHFPSVTESNDEIYFHLVAVQGDNRTFRLRRSP